MDLDASAVRWVVRRYAWLRAVRAEPVSGLILPDARHFPDPFDRSPSAAERLLARVLRHAGLDDVDVALHVVESDGRVESTKGGCASGACAAPSSAHKGRLVRRPDGGHALEIGADELAHPVLLTTALVRGTSALFLAEAEADRALAPEEREAVLDLCAVALGFGVLMANGSYIYAKGCGGVRITSATRLSCEELALGLALFLRLHGPARRAAARHLDVTPAAHLDEAWALFASNDHLVAALRDDPESLERDAFSLHATRSWLARLFFRGARAGGGPVPLPSEDELRAALRRAPSPRRDAARPTRAPREEIRSLVDEALTPGGE